MDALALKRRIIYSLRKQGFSIQNGKILPPNDLTKETIRNLHQAAVHHQHIQSKKRFFKKEKHLISRVASGWEIEPWNISPRLIKVQSKSHEELLFRYVSLHWSIPVSSGYGRRLRFLVIDEHNDKIIGLIGLGDPVFSLHTRDEWIGWTKQDRIDRLRYVMDAFVLGAIPPYSFLLFGKLVAMLAASNEVREVFRKKYRDTRSLIQDKVHDGRLALITTTSALGRSSMYNRIRFKDRLLYKSVGFTKGYGEFHFSDGLYSAIGKYVSEHSEPTAKQESWGVGFRNRREVIRKCLLLLGLSGEWLNHGIKREVYVIPMAENSRLFLQGKHSRLRWFNQSTLDIFDYFRERWLLPRIHKDNKYRTWSKEDWLIWTSKEQIND